MSAPHIRGWCPGALRPMQSGDGLVVRLRPNGGRLTRAQAAAIALSARRHGNGLLDLTTRGNLQLRGVRADSHPALITDLDAAGLVDDDPTAEARRNILVTPFADPATDALAGALTDALRHGPDLPGKFGFVIDTGRARILTASPGDIRVERDQTGGLILRCDGADLGAPVDAADLPPAALQLAHWFLDAGGAPNGRGRMAALIARGAVPPGSLAGRVAPAMAATAPGPGLVPEGALLGVEFGLMRAETLALLAELGDLRVTPWRMLLVEGLRDLPDLPGLILRADDPRRRIVACSGAPACPQALQPVRPLAQRLAMQVPPGRMLHVSGCTKGCAHPGPADLTLTATARGFDLILRGRAGDPPARRGLTPDALDLKGPAR